MNHASGHKMRQEARNELRRRLAFLKHSAGLRAPVNDQCQSEIDRLEYELACDLEHAYFTIERLDGEPGTRRHGGSIRNSTGIDLQGRAVTNADLESIGALDYLEVLDLNNTQIGDEGLAHLKHFTQLHELFLGGTNVTSTGIRNLLPLPLLCLLVLFRTKVDDSAISCIMSCPKLDSVFLDETLITNKGFLQLTNRSTLKSIFIRGTKITADAVAGFRRKLPACRVEC